MEKESEDAMAPDQETIRLLFYIVRLRDMVDILYKYTSMMMIEVIMK